ncbi:MAG TPA: hypothetical protein VNO23_16140 [Candidatus Binatia bacterium]|nr:hypothetical protein [Candidatus Binatia bacterium]
MLRTCECEGTDPGAPVTVCQECGTACCRSCRLEIETRTYCRWCATSLAASA